MNATYLSILNSDVGKLLEKAAIEPVPFAKRQEGFYSTFFLVPKKSGELRPVLNLRPLNQYLETKHFKIDTLSKVLNFVKKGDWGISVDLRRLFSYINSPSSSQVSSCSAFKGKLFNTEHWHLAQRPHQGCISCGSTFENAEHKVSSVSRRLVSTECSSEAISKRQASNSQSPISIVF